MKYASVAIFGAFVLVAILFAFHVNAVFEEDTFVGRAHLAAEHAQFDLERIWAIGEGELSEKVGGSKALGKAPEMSKDMSMAAGALLWFKDTEHLLRYGVERHLLTVDEYRESSRYAKEHPLFQWRDEDGALRIRSPKHIEEEARDRAERARIVGQNP